VFAWRLFATILAGPCTSQNITQSFWEEVEKTNNLEIM